MTDLCSHVQYGVPGSLLACSREAGHDGECVFDRIPLQEEYGGIRFRLHTWSIPLLTGEAINEAEMKARAVLAIEEAKRYPNDEYPGRLVHEKATLARAYLQLASAVDALKLAIEDYMRPGEGDKDVQLMEIARNIAAWDAAKEVKPDA